MAEASAEEKHSLLEQLRRENDQKWQQISDAQQALLLLGPPEHLANSSLLWLQRESHFVSSGDWSQEADQLWKELIDPSIPLGRTDQFARELVDACEELRQTKVILENDCDRRNTKVAEMELIKEELARLKSEMLVAIQETSDNRYTQAKLQTFLVERTANDDNLLLIQDLKYISEKIDLSLTAKANSKLAMDTNDQPFTSDTHSAPDETTTYELVQQQQPLSMYELILNLLECASDEYISSDVAAKEHLQFLRENELIESAKEDDTLIHLRNFG
jgi:hypothetical protein